MELGLEKRQRPTIKGIASTNSEKLVLLYAEIGITEKINLAQNQG
jgi:hypothetical protein